jgi:hypothetical protein
VARRPRRTVAATFGLVGLALVTAGCGSSLFATTVGTAATSTTTTSTTAPTVNGVAVGVPVAGCTAGAVGGAGAAGAVGGAGSASTGGLGQPSGSGASGTAAQGGSVSGGGDEGGSSGWRPSFMLAPIPTALISQLEFYSDGLHTVLAPSGWTCTALAPSNQESELVVYPTGDPDPPTTGGPVPGSQGIFAFFDTTEEPQGIALVCPFFTVPSWQQREAFCVSGHVPTGEQTTMPTPDVAAVTDPAGVVGTLPGSGGPHPVSGVVIFPQVMPAVQQGDSIAVAQESCSLTSPMSCPTIL